MKNSTLILISFLLFQGCSDDKMETKGFQVNEIAEDEEGKKIIGLPIDSLAFETRPGNVLLTNNPTHRLTPIYKVNYHKKTGKPFVGSNHFHTYWNREVSDGNNWHDNFMPGFEAVYGYNLVNISHYNLDSNTQNEFFKKHVLIKTLYFPSFSNDTLNNQPVNRNYYMVSVYDEDTNKDGMITMKDLRRFYLFDVEGHKKMALVPKNYSVMSSEYDSSNDYMYVVAKLDQNINGQMEQEELTHIFWIDLKNPENTGVLYQNK